MADDEAKAQKLALAKKRVAELKKKKKGAGAKKDDGPAEPSTSATAPATAASPDEAESKGSAATEDAASVADVAVASPTTDTHDADDDADDDAEKVEDKGECKATPAPLAQGGTGTSLSQQSKARSTSFRKASISTAGAGVEPSLFSPEGDTAPDIYRKQVARIDELERENKRLAKDATDAEKRWQQAEEELADLREGEGGTNKGSDGGEIASLKHELAALQRQNAQLQARTTPLGGRHGSSSSMSLMSPPPTSELEAQLQSRAATIETMELEMSRLRAQVQRLSAAANDGGSSPVTPAEQQQIMALEDKLARAERAAGLAQGELGDLKRNLERASEKAVKEGSSRASAETRVRALEREKEELAAARDEAARKADALEKKVTTLTTLHREQDGRAQALRKELADVKTRAERAEAEATRLRKKDAAEGGRGAGVDDEGVDELEDEVRQRLERRVRELEAENSDLRRGIWHERRREMQVGPDGEPAAPTDGAGLPPFSDVDLSGQQQARGRKASSGGGGLGDFLATGLNALTGVAAGGHEGGAGHQRRESLGLLEDDDMDFDEETFRRAQEEEQKRRIERIKEFKRMLKNWEGWRMDVVENRRGGGEGVGEIFEV